MIEAYTHVSRVPQLVGIEAAFRRAREIGQGQPILGLVTLVFEYGPVRLYLVRGILENFLQPRGRLLYQGVTLAPLPYSMFIFPSHRSPRISTPFPSLVYSSG